jgi:hypothetical protein
VKILDIWAYLKKGRTKDNMKIDNDLVQIALRQEMEYEDAKAKENGH